MTFTDPATWTPITPAKPLTPKKPTLAPATPLNPPTTGNAIVANPLSWHQMIVSALVVGVSIWVVEQYVDPKYAFLLAVLILFGVMYAYSKKGFVAELNAIVKGTA